MPGRNRGLWHGAPLAWEIAALGHTVKLMPPAYVKPYVKRGKTDAADAEAICEAVTRLALANKTARIAWAVMTRGKTYEAPVAAPSLFTRQSKRLLGGWMCQGGGT